MDGKPNTSMATALGLVAVLSGLMIASSFLKGYPAARSACVGLAGLVAVAFYFRLAIQWINGRTLRQKRPPDPP